ncbi:uncharacterized protein LOC142987529 [Anticarsia gemmatalis]|uniref:uncharacterized protein LOC142987529 n=1 Tax=Anticarsia gemmatalis TaxID=129554 RepID=UPI003F76EC48
MSLYYYLLFVFINLLMCSYASGIWVSASGGVIPDGAVIGGVDNENRPLFVVRARVDDNVVPGKLVTTFAYSHIPWYGKEIQRAQYEVLINGPNRWVPCRGKNIPSNAFRAGVESGTAMYICRGHVLGVRTVGKVHSGYGICYLPFAGNEHSISAYEILVEDANC